MLLIFVVVVLAVSADQANENVTPFDSVDKDSNGAIDYNEFEKWQKNGLGIHNEQVIKETFARVDASKDQVIDVSEFVPLAYEISQKPVDTTEEIFKRMDLNGDRIVDKAEADVARREYDSGIIDGVLAIADSNRDGQLTYEEFTAQLNYNKPKNQDEINKETAHQLVSYIDTNGDKKLEVKEVYQFANQFNTVAEAEIQEAFRLLDGNKDGFLVVAEMEKLPSKMTNLLRIETPPSLS